MTTPTTPSGDQAPALPTSATPTSDPRLERLHQTIRGMDAMSQEGFSRIEALAWITLQALETPKAYRFPELIAQTLETIRSIAQASMDAVNSNAEEVGCNWTDPAEHRRSAAWQAMKPLNDLAVQEGASA